MSQDPPIPRDPAAAGQERWDTMASEDITGLSLPLWRRFCDQLHVWILREWTGGTRFASAFKTDLFDEVVGAGLVDCLLSVSVRVVGFVVESCIVEMALE